jgi:DNA oxidative demethylase
MPNELGRSEVQGLTADLFADAPDLRPAQEIMAEGAVLLRGFARPTEADLTAALRNLVVEAPLRQMVTPGGHRCRWR